MNRRWWSGDDLDEWKMLAASGQCDAPFFVYPYQTVAGLRKQLEYERFVALYAGRARKAGIDLVGALLEAEFHSYEEVA